MPAQLDIASLTPVPDTPSWSSASRRCAVCKAHTVDEEGVDHGCYGPACIDPGWQPDDPYPPRHRLHRSAWLSDYWFCPSHYAEVVARKAWRDLRITTRRRDIERHFPPHFTYPWASAPDTAPDQEQLALFPQEAA